MLSKMCMRSLSQPTPSLEAWFLTVFSCFTLHLHYICRFITLNGADLYHLCGLLRLWTLFHWRAVVLTFSFCWLNMQHFVVACVLGFVSFWFCTVSLFAAFCCCMCFVCFWFCIVYVFAAFGSCCPFALVGHRKKNPIHEKVHIVRHLLVNSCNYFPLPHDICPGYF